MCLCLCILIIQYSNNVCSFIFDNTLSAESLKQKANILPNTSYVNFLECIVSEYQLSCEHLSFNTHSKLIFLLKIFSDIFVSYFFSFVLFYFYFYLSFSRSIYSHFFRDKKELVDAKALDNMSWVEVR